MFKVDKDDGLFTLNSVFLLFKEKKLVYLMMFKDDTDTSKKWGVYSINPFEEVTSISFKDLKIPWKIGQDSLSAKNVSKSIESIEQLGYEVYFWPCTLPKDIGLREFYILNIKKLL